VIRAAVVGATGYTGGELLQYLVRHPKVRITHCTSESSAGKPLSDLHPWLAGRALGQMRLQALAVGWSHVPMDIISFHLDTSRWFENSSILQTSFPPHV
jgi:N-acetyl-gamma-glutamylphosphate reductase